MGPIKSLAWGYCVLAAWRLPLGLRAQQPKGPPPGSWSAPGAPPPPRWPPGPHSDAYRPLPQTEAPYARPLPTQTEAPPVTDQHAPTYDDTGSSYPPRQQELTAQYATQAQAQTVNQAAQQPTPEIDKEYFFTELKKMYKRKMLPLELSSRYDHFASAPLGPADFDAKPMVLLIGQYSVGKTSFIRSLLGRDFPGQRIGPEPTTDRFVCVMDADRDRVVPGNALAMRSDKPFAGLQTFGNRFLEKLQGAEVSNSPILQNVTFVDTPGVLAGAKQRLGGGRDYDFRAVVSWFAERSDMIVLMFDAHKLDISDELKETIDALRPHYAKVRVVLNKADSVAPRQLLRVYGALMWQLGRVMATPEVVRVHLVGSFSAGHQDRRQHPPYSSTKDDDFGELLRRERDDLLTELRLLPRNAVLRRVNDLSKRGRFLKVHCYLIHYLRKQMPYLFGKDEKRVALLNNLHREFAACAHRYGLSLGDFPNVDTFRGALSEVKDIRAFPKLDKQLVYDMDKMFAQDIPKLLDKAAGRVVSSSSHHVDPDTSSSSSSSASRPWASMLHPFHSSPPPPPSEAIPPAGAPPPMPMERRPPPGGGPPPSPSPWGDTSYYHHDLR